MPAPGRASRPPYGRASSASGRVGRSVMRPHRMTGAGVGAPSPPTAGRRRRGPVPATQAGSRSPSGSSTPTSSAWRSSAGRRSSGVGSPAPALRAACPRAFSRTEGAGGSGGTEPVPRRSAAGASRSSGTKASPLPSEAPVPAALSTSWPPATELRAPVLPAPWPPALALAAPARSAPKRPAPWPRAPARSVSVPPVRAPLAPAPLAPAPVPPSPAAPGSPYSGRTFPFVLRPLTSEDRLNRSRPSERPRPVRPPASPRRPPSRRISPPR
ncbi:hypothetical protein GA0115251_10881, partial [Streptomyces sp. TverLS-915]